MLAGAAGLAGTNAQDSKNAIVLHVDFSVDPEKEQTMLRNFRTMFKPAAMKFPGYIDVKMLKLRSALVGPAPAGVNYRFQLTYESEELRKKWVSSEVHQKVWPTIENTMRSKDYTVLLFDSL
jgi:hypothetical protein